MRILHVTDRPGTRGGAGVWLQGLLAGQRVRHELHLAVGRRDPTARVPVPTTRVRGLAHGDRRPVADRLEALRRSLRPDVVHVHNALNPEALDWAADRGAIATVQDHRVFCPGRGKLVPPRPDQGEPGAGEVCRQTMGAETCRACFDDVPHLQRMLELTRRRLDAIRRMPAVTTLSHYVARELAEVGVPEERLHVVPPFAPDDLREEAGSSPDPELSPHVLFAGRLVRAKGVEEAVEAWRAADLDQPLVFAGDGWMRPGLEQAGFRVLGWVPRTRMAGIYRRARALLMPSRWQEPFGLVGLEALHHGVPVAAWDSGGIAEWLPEPPTPWGDVPALARRLREVVGRSAAAPPGFDRNDALARFDALYRARAGEDPAAP